MEENHFIRQERKATATDIELARCYFPLLKELAKNGRKVSFKEFVDTAKAAYPNNPAVQSAIPVTTGRRFEFIRIYLKEHNLPDLSAQVTNLASENSDTYSKDFDPQAERDATQLIDWDQYEGGDWGEYIKLNAKMVMALKRRTEPQARKVMADYFATIKDKIPNPKKEPMWKVAGVFREALIEGLKEGRDAEEVFNDVVFDVTESRSADA